MAPNIRSPSARWDAKTLIPTAPASVNNAISVAASRNAGNAATGRIHSLHRATMATAESAMSRTATLRCSATAATPLTRMSVTKTSEAEAPCGAVTHDGGHHEDAEDKDNQESGHAAGAQPREVALAKCLKLSRNWRTPNASGVVRGSTMRTPCRFGVADYRRGGRTGNLSVRPDRRGEEGIGVNLAQSLLHALKAHGAKEIFGIPGDFALPFFKVIEESGILPLYTLSHEPVRRLRRRRRRARALARSASPRSPTAPARSTWSIRWPRRSPRNRRSWSSPARRAQARRAAASCCITRARRWTRSFGSTREITCDQARLDDAAARAGARSRGCCAAASRIRSPVYLELPRDMVDVPCAPVAAAPPPATTGEALAACVDEILERAREGDVAGDDGGRGSAPLRTRGEGRGTRACGSACRS